MSCISHINLCPDFGDTENVLLQKILQSLNAGGGSGGAGVSGLSVNGGPFQTGQVSIVTGGGGVTSVNGDSGPAVLLDSGDIPEASNLYFTTARVRATDLTGLVIVGGAVSAADTILDALGKFQFRVDALETGASGPFVLRAGDSMTGPLLQAAGTAGAPSFSFTADTDTGIYSSIADRVQFSAGGVLVFSIRSGAVGLAQDTGYFFLGTSETVRLYRDGVGSMGQRSGVTPQRFRVYETFTSTSIYSRVALSSESSLFRLYTEAAGGATLRSLQVGTGESSGTDIAGMDTLHHGGQNTGAGIPGALVFQTGSVGASGAGVSALTTRLTVAHDAVTATVPFLGIAGTAALPAFSFSSDSNTGIFSVAADDLGFSTGGVQRLMISTTALTSTLSILGPDGTAAAPAFSFSSDPNTGIFQTGVADTLGVSTGGVVRVTLDTVNFVSTLPILGPAGTAALPTFSFSADPNTGIYNSAADTLAFSTGGVVRQTLSTTTLTSTLPERGPDGTAAAPSYSFTSETNTGMYRSAAGTLSFSTLGASRLDLSATSIITWASIFGVNGSASFPAFSFLSDVNTGMLSVGADLLGFSAGGTTRLTLSTTTLTSTVPFLGPAGTASLPTFSFSGDPNTGLYNVGADQIGLSTNGVLRVTYNTTDAIFAAGYRLAFSSGTNQRAGNATLVAGTVTVANTSVTGNTIVLITRKTSGGTIGLAITYTVSTGVSFTINSDSAIDTSTFSYFLIEVP